MGKPSPVTGTTQRVVKGTRVVYDVEEQARWRSDVDQVITGMARHGAAFTVEDVRERVVRGEPAYPNAWGARFTAAVRRGTIARVGTRPATHRASRGRAVSVWAGVGSLRGHHG